MSISIYHDSYVKSSSIDEDSIWEVMCLDIFQCLSIIGILRNLVLSWYLKNNANNIRFQIHKKRLTQSQTRKMYRCLSLIISKTSLSLYISNCCSFEKKRRRVNAFWLVKLRSCATMQREGQSSNSTRWIACLPQSNSLNQQHWIAMMTGRIWKGRKVVLVLKTKNKSIKLLSYSLSKDWRICILKELITFTFAEKGWICDLSV